LLKKHEKDLKPVSLRVRDAAELLLTCLIEEIGSFPTSCSSQSFRLVDENVLLCASGKETTKSNLKLDTNLFRFFASEGTVYRMLENGQGLSSKFISTLYLLVFLFVCLFCYLNLFSFISRLRTSYYHIVEKRIWPTIMDLPNASFASA